MVIKHFKCKKRFSVSNICYMDNKYKIINVIFFIPGNISNRLRPSILKFLQERLQQHMNQELPDVQAGYRNGRGATDQIANICWIIDHRKKQGKSRKKSTSVLLTML